jgi:DSF synthase
MTVINQPTCTLFTDTERFTQLSGYYEAERHTVWMMLRAQPRPCFNHALIRGDHELFMAGSPVRFCG